MKGRGGCQTVYDRSGEVAFAGEWNAKALFEAISAGNPNYWAGRRVLDIGANTAGLSLEIARQGAEVVAIEPDPYLNCRALTLEIIQQAARDEGLSISCEQAGLFDAHTFGKFDTVLCLGLLYHFRDPQYCLDYLSTTETEHLIVSTQTEPGDALVLANRVGLKFPSGFFPESTVLTGWHPTRPLFERMLKWAGFDDVTPLTDPSINFPRKPAGLTNSAYYRATKVATVDPVKSLHQYYPR